MTEQNMLSIYPAVNCPKTKEFQKAVICEKCNRFNCFSVLGVMCDKKQGDEK